MQLSQNIVNYSSATDDDDSNNLIAKDSRRSWFVCLGASLLVGLSMGLNNSFGVLYVSLLEEFQQSKRKTALIGSLEFIWYMLISPFSNHLVRMFGFRRVVFAGNILFCLGIFLSTFVPNLNMLCLTYGFIFGTGTMLLYIPAVTVIYFCFKNHLATCSGIVAASNSFFTLWVGPVYEYLIRKYGWRLAGKALTIMVVPLSIGCALFPGKGQVILVEEKDVALVLNLKMFLKRFLGNKAFLVWLLMMYLVYLGAFIPLIHLISFSKDISIATNVSVFSVSVMCVFDALGKLFFGKCLDFCHWNIYTINSIALLVIAVAITLLPLANQVSHIFLFSAFYGCAFGVHCLMVFVITPQLCDPEDSKMSVAYLFSALSIPGGMGPALAGWIYDATSSYQLAFFIAGGLFAVASCLGVCVPLLTTSHLHLISGDRKERVELGSSKSWAAEMNNDPSTSSSSANSDNPKLESILERLTVL